MKKIIHFSILIVLSLLSNASIAQQFGDPGWAFDQSKYDSKYPAMREYAKAGVQGGIPYRSSLVVKKQLKPGDNIQRAIDQVASQGGGVVLLKNGKYRINSTIKMKSKVVLRGENKNKVTLESYLRGTPRSKKNTIELKGVESAGLEDLTVKFIASGATPQDDTNNAENSYCGKCWKNDPSGKKDLYVRLVLIDKSTKNSWIDNCNFLESGTDPLFLSGKFITCRNNLVDRSYNKGPGGNGYYDVRTEYSLFVNETVKRIRHFSIQQGAKYNVVLNSNFEVDINYHNKDKGNNLVEKNTIKIKRWRGWGAFGTGGAQYGHTAPGPRNIIYNNSANNKGKVQYSGNRTIYTFKGYGNPSVLSNTPPKSKTFYPVKRSGGTGGGENQLPVVRFSGISNGVQLASGASIKPVVNASDADGSIANVKLYLNNEFIRQESAAPYEWGHLANKDEQLKNLEDGNYTLKAEATDNKGGKTTKTLNFKVGNTNSGGQLISNGTYFINSTTSNQRLISRAQENHNAFMINAGNYNDQKWIFNYLGDNVYTIKNSSTNRFLEVPYGRCGNNNNVATYTSAGGGHQKWKAIKNGNTFAFTPMHCQNVALDRAAGAINANIHTWSYSVTNQNQKWRVEPIATNRNLSINKGEDKSIKVILYPNPAKDRIRLKGLQSNAYVKVINSFGTTVITTQLNDNVLDIDKLPSGVYSLQTDTATKIQFIKK